MAERLTEMVDYPTVHVPKLDAIVAHDELPNIYVFENGVDRSDAEPRVLTSVDELMDAREANEVELTPTEVVVTVPIVSWPDDPFLDHPRSNGDSE